MVHGLMSDDWTVIDAFENPSYDLTLIDTHPDSGAWAYTCPEGMRVAARDWSAQHFLDHELAAYLDRVKAWRDRYAQRRA